MPAANPQEGSIFLKHLETSSVWKVTNPKYDVCMLLNFWIYDKLTDIYKGQNSSDDINIAFGSLQGVWNKIYYYPQNSLHHNKCKPEFDIVKHHDWKQRKELYDYCVNYEFIEPMCKYFSDQCKEHCEYIEAKSHIYKHFEQLCTPEESSHTFTKNARLGHSVLGVAPVLLSATALYRYTPVGSWIRKLGGYNINGMTNMNGVEIDEFSSYTQEPGDMLFGGTENYISYQPM
ncbi:PIR Superfamily Protein [Plasmodium ovale wallikeri]|uniref:PIR Superfamily Protein n=1 Tax=Plasmodium ovale wallikeri TaxID=864142 RepID=A0A1A9ARP3_PLAOA|nr:PIR Superfamily Protein [Plasmodium ovale wallikeri]SBT59384.1 PIR Superfamily Protein [Plasmodium ovale wallikeri]